MLIAVLILEIIVGIGGIVLRSKTEQYLNETLLTTMHEYNQTNDAEVTALWDTMQNEVRLR